MITGTCTSGRGVKQKKGGRGVKAKGDKESNSHMGGKEPKIEDVKSVKENKTHSRRRNEVI